MFFNGSMFKHRKSKFISYHLISRFEPLKKKLRVKFVEMINEVTEIIIIINIRIARDTE